MHNGRHQPRHENEQPEQDHGEEEIAVIDGFLLCSQPHVRSTGNHAVRSRQKRKLAYWIIRLAPRGRKKKIDGPEHTSRAVRF